VEGFLHWATDELGSLSSVQRATKEEGAPQFWALLFLVPVARLVRSLLCIQFHCISLLVVSFALITII
jgi:hypothetical protein